ncbi:isovaleryl-CoA dehydrogenase [Kordiimonas sediminis]|uniref:Isovaleryl-CoA dehydrogenase n=1 Tax=Kordiimonas sediminis TaxID=1735581 RepID=A0A919AWQ6_9PROT|nr:acyl-CoA dehydrogenase family protein [Kordiimonas sediminis]GHF26758.1 isovaleryl-CoA dehydrogenase [Kordiimonas sediminis]
MALVLNEEQQLLKESADGFFAEKAPVSQLRKLRDDRDETGYSKELWSEMAEMGFAGLLMSEDEGGVDFGAIGAGIVAESMGKNLSASPFFASAIVGASLIKHAGSTAQKEAILPAIASGEVIVTLAVDETGHHGPASTTLKAVKSSDSYVLNGMKTFVPDAHVADKIIVVARTAGEKGDAEGLSLFIIDKGQSGLIIDQTVMADSRNWGKVTLEDVIVSEDAVLGTVGEAFPVLDKALDVGRCVLSAELLGISQEVLDRTVQYLQERKQFGTLIGTFQGLQHRAAHLYSEVEILRSAVLKALQAVDAGTNPAWFASLAKAKACKVAELATNEAIQMHGGIGMTDEFEIGFFIKRARAVQNLYGGYNYHTDRFASLSGY